MVYDWVMKYVITILLLFGFNFLVSGINLPSLVHEKTSIQTQLQTDDTESPQPNDHTEDPYFCTISFPYSLIWGKIYLSELFSYKHSLACFPLKPPDSFSC